MATRDFLVSIPYRLATNRRSSTRFKRNAHTVSIPYRLATNCSSEDIQEVVLSFQFLIGWLQTKTISKRKETNNDVSIPYRLATNINCNFFFNTPFVVSIPYRLATNTRT